MVHYWAMYLNSLLLLLLHLLLGRAGAPVAGPVVHTKYGPLEGLRLQFPSTSSKHLDPVTAYLGIPYASPPINAYRFMPPVAPLPWRETRTATSLPPACPQRFPDISNRTRALEMMTAQRYLFLSRLIPHLANQSEDCLYLNFYVPSSQNGEESRPGTFPVLLLIHGESWEWGSGNEFDGAPLASLGNLIVVTFNYRLGPLGFLKTSNQQSNFGLLDVIAALHWVRENADAFGGDRNRITLLGYKTGAVVANLLLVAQIAKGLFQRAVLISGSVLSPWALQRRPEEVARELSKELGCLGKLPLSHPESDLAPCLRKKALSDILTFVPTSPKFLSPYAPYVDNVLLNNPRSVMESVPNQFARAELLLMFTTAEGAHELSDGELRAGFESEHRDRILRTLVRNVFSYHQQEIFSIIRNEYTDWDRPILHPIPLRDSTVEALTDCLALGPALQVALTHAKRGAKTWVLHFAHVSKEREGTTGGEYERLGSMEGDIVPYLMGLPVTSGQPPLGQGGALLPSSPFGALNFSRQDALISEALVQYVAHFVRSGDPNLADPSSSSLDPADDWSRESPLLSSRGKGRLHWDSYDPVSQWYLVLGGKARMRSHYRGHKMALWLNLIPQIHLPGGSDVTFSHHTFSDDNPNLYIGPVRPLSASSLSVGDQVPGFSVVVRDATSAPGSGSLTTTECLEVNTDSPLSQGTRHSVLRIDSNEVEVEIRGSGDPVVPLSSSPGGLHTNPSAPPTEYDYTTALTVTITVGVCLILLNLLVFSAIMCHRKRAIPSNHGERSGSEGSDTESRRSSQAGTPQKYQQIQAQQLPPHQEDYKWSTSCCSSTTANDFPSHLSSYPPESISMNQYHQDHLFATLPRQGQQVFHPDPGGGSLKRHMGPAPPDIFPDGNDQGGMRLYMNQTAVGENLLDIPPPDELGVPPLPPLPLNSHPMRPCSQPSSQPGMNSTTTSTSSNPSPNGGGSGTGLVSVLKRHPGSTGTVKKRVQIQEISV